MALHAGERNFRDFFRLPPTKENRSQSADPACQIVLGFVMWGEIFDIREERHAARKWGTWLWSVVVKSLYTYGTNFYR